MLRISDSFKSGLYSMWYDWMISPAVTSSFEPMVEKFLSGVGEGERVLSVGCGGGQAEIEIARSLPSATIVGLDYSAYMAAAAGRRSREAGGGQRALFLQGTAVQLPFADGTFDHIFSPGSIKHWPDHLTGLRECVRVLAPSGTLLVMDADRGCTFPAVTSWMARTRMPSALLPLLRCYFRTYVAGQGLSIEEVSELFQRLPVKVEEGPFRTTDSPVWAIVARKSTPAI